MALYIILWTLLLAFCLAPKKKTLPLNLFLAFMVFIAGGRGINVGVDTPQYFDIFNMAGGGTYVEWVEPLWNVICWLVYSFVSTDFNIFLIIISFITLSIVFYISYKESPNPYLSLFIYVSLHMYMASFNIMRQYVGMSFVFLAWYYLIQNYKKKSLLTMIVATGFHYSCIFAFLSYLWIKIKLSRKKIIILLLISFVFGALMNERLLSIFTISIFDYFLEKDNVFRENISMVIIMTIVQNLFALYILYTTDEKKYLNCWFKLFILSMLAFNATFMIFFAARLYSIFAICQIIYFSIYLKEVKGKQRFLSRLVVFFYLAAQFFRILLANGNDIMPYSNVFV